MKFLSDAEITQLRAQHKKEKDKRICDRIKAVLLYDKGWTFPEIAEALLLSHDAIREHVDDFKRLHKLSPENGGSKEKLSLENSEKLEMHLQSHIYLYAKDIIEYIQSEWKISYTVPGITDWLKRHGFSYKKPALVPGKASIEQQKKWLIEYEALKQNLGPTETIGFIDGVHPTHNVMPNYGWIKKGQRKEIPTNTGRSRLNLTGMLDIISHKVLLQEDKTLNAEATINFFQKIESAYPTKSKVHLFCDNAMFKSAVLNFFKTLQLIAPDSTFGRSFRSRVRDRFRPIGT